MEYYDQIPFCIDGLICNKFEIRGELQEGETDLEIGFSYGVRPGTHHVRCTMSYTISQGNDIRVFLDLTCLFSMPKKAFEERKKGNTFILSADDAQYLATINVGAARGELHARASQYSTAWEKLTLPPVNLLEAITKDVLIELKS